MTAPHMGTSPPTTRTPPAPHPAPATPPCAPRRRHPARGVLLLPPPGFKGAACPPKPRWPCPQERAGAALSHSFHTAGFSRSRPRSPVPLPRWLLPISTGRRGGGRHAADKDGVCVPPPARGAWPCPASTNTATGGTGPRSPSPHPVPGAAAGLEELRPRCPPGLRLLGHGSAPVRCQAGHGALPAAAGSGLGAARLRLLPNPGAGARTSTFQPSERRLATCRGARQTAAATPPPPAGARDGEPRCVPRSPGEGHGPQPPRPPHPAGHGDGREAPVPIISAGTARLWSHQCAQRGWNWGGDTSWCLLRQSWDPQNAPCGPPAPRAAMGGGEGGGGCSAVPGSTRARGWGG